MTTNSKRQVKIVGGKRFVLVEERELRQLERRAAANTVKLPEYPPADAKGSRPAVEFARTSIARSIIDDRLAAGLSQEELARLAGVRQETISRLESGKHSPTLRTIEKIDRATRAALQKTRAKRGK
jgi:DNA-binding XRE family transcriptional regulator